MLPGIAVLRSQVQRSLAECLAEALVTALKEPRVLAEGLATANAPHAGGDAEPWDADADDCPLEFQEISEVDFANARDAYA